MLLNVGAVLNGPIRFPSVAVSTGSSQALSFPLTGASIRGNLIIETFIL